MKGLRSLRERVKELIDNCWKQARLPRLGLLLLLTHFLLGAIYSVTVPIWEAYDETGHYPYVRYLAVYRGLPPIGGQISQWLDESHQPPLYYFLGALGTFWIDTSDNLEPEINIHAWDGTGRRGYNIAFHPPEEGSPYRGTVLAIHLVRLLSVLIGTVTVWLTYLLSKEVFPDREEIALGAMSIVSFCPLFLFMCSVVNNDILVALFAALVLLLLLRTLSRGRPDYRQMIPLGVSLGLALLTKNSALALIPLVLVALTLPLVRRRWGVLSTLLGAISMSLAAALVCGWWYLRNYLLYGTPLPDRAQNNPITTTFAPFVTSVKQSITPRWFETLFSNSFRSFWGYFGWGNVHITDLWVYQALGALTLLSLIGLILFFRSRFPTTTKLSIALLLLSLIFFTILPLYRAIFFQDPYLLPGRYLLPAVSVIGILLSTGLSSLFPRGRSVYIFYALGGSLFLLALITPFFYIAPAYARPPLLSQEELESIPHRLDTNFGRLLQLLGYELAEQSVTTGDSVYVTLYWQSTAPMDEDYSISVKVFGPGNESLGQVDTYPGLGSFPTTLWEVGNAIADRYAIPIVKKIPYPSAGLVEVTVYKYPTFESLRATDPRGRPVGRVIIGRVRLLPRRLPTYKVANRVEYNLGNEVALIGYEIDRTEITPGGSLHLTLYWKAISDVKRDYTVFTHLIDEGGKIWAQKDNQPVAGEYPTSLWAEGEVVKDDYYLYLKPQTSPGWYSLEVGIYLLESMERLPIIDSRGEVSGDRGIIGEIYVR